MPNDITMPLPFDEIEVPEGRREVNAGTVKRLAESIEKIGLRHPITVRRKGEKYILVAGRHRMEACRKLGREHVPATIVSMTKADARLWEIAENLHRADLSKLERDENVAEWIRLTEVSSQLAKKPQGGRPESGINAASRELGIDKDEAYRAVKVDSLSEEAKQAAREAGLDNNRAALLDAAKEPSPASQVARVRDIADRRASRVDADVRSRAAKEVAEIIAEYVPADAWDAVKANLYAAGAASIANALTNIAGHSIMDARFK